jgi:hypothetical protein
MTEDPPIRDRKRGQKNSGFLESMGIDLSNLNLQITLNPEDKELIQSTLKDISDKVDRRWKFTQILMIVAITLSGGAQVANWVVFGA